MFVVGEFTGVHKHAVFRADFVFEVRLTGIILFCHGFAAAGALNIAHTVVSFANPGVATVKKVGHPGFFQLFGLAIVKPKALAAAALVNDDLAMENLHRAFYHLCITLRTIHLNLLTCSLFFGFFCSASPPECQCLSAPADSLIEPRSVEGRIL
jgi:hypothetical protein